MALFTVVKKNSYQDSINLMLLTNEVNALEGVNKSQIMMGTDANKDIFNNAGLLTDEAAAADPSDMVVVVDADDEATVDEVLAVAEKFLSDLSTKKEASGIQEASNWEEALAMLPDANLALFSTPGEYTAEALGHAGNVKVTVTIDDDGRISAVSCVGDMETPTVGGYAMMDLPAVIIKAQGTDIDLDAFTGATNTTKGVLQAVDACLAQAAK